MRHIFIFIITIFITYFSSAQIISRHENETAEMFANRIKPDSTEIAHTIIETKQLDSTKNAIIAFYRKTIYEVRQMPTYVDRSQYNILLGYLLLPTTNGDYEKIEIDTIPPDGGDPEISAIFFANADKDKDKELIVLCKYEQRHYDYVGAFYETCIFDYSKDKKDFTYLNQLSAKFWGCECSWRNGKTETAKYKTADDIRTKLKQLGFNR